MRLKDAYPSNYLGADDFVQPQTLTIERCEMRNVGLDKIEEKPVVFFRGSDKPLILNVTNFKTIVSICGDETDDWPGGVVEIFSAKTMYMGEETDCVRLRAPAARPIPSTQQPEAAAVGTGNNPAPEDDIAF